MLDKFEMAKNKESGSITSPEKELRDPDFCIGGFELWIYGRQFPDSDDYWDGNWLDVIARCTAASSVVEAAGCILHLAELHGLMAECKQIYDTLAGEAKLECLEPNIGLKIKMKNGGHCELTVSITPDHLYQEHSFIFDLDQSYLPPLIKSLELILHSYPVKGWNHHSPIRTSHEANNNKEILRKVFNTVPAWIKRSISCFLGKRFL